VRNKACLVAQHFSQVESLDFVVIFAHIARLEIIRIFLAFATSKGFKLYQMNVKSVFQNGVIQEAVFVRQPPPQVLRTPSIIIECTSFQMFCTDLSKRHGYGMLGLRASC
jgi:hypothetical protein